MSNLIIVFLAFLLFMANFTWLIVFDTMRRQRNLFKNQRDRAQDKLQDCLYELRSMQDEQKKKRAKILGQIKDNAKEEGCINSESISAKQHTVRKL